MTQFATRADIPASPAALRAEPQRPQPFCGLIDAVIVDGPVLERFAGSISRDAAMAIWTWVYRDLCAESLGSERVLAGEVTAAELEQLMPEVLSRMKAGLTQAAAEPELMRRLTAQLGLESARERLPIVMLALRNRALLGKAQAFGKATNTIHDEAALGAAMQAMPLQDPALAALLFHAALGQVNNPTMLVTAAIKLAGAAKESAVTRIGFGPLIEAYVAHAQNQMRFFDVTGTFADIDLVCRALERFHRLVRALTGYMEFTRGAHATTALSAITKQVSERLEPRLKDIVTNINNALRRREGADRIDNDAMLAAINGMYLLVAVRDCRDSLALNAIVDQAWSQSGQAMEIHIQRVMDQFRQTPGDPNSITRLDVVIKLAEIRFSPDYAETLRRARQAAARG